MKQLFIALAALSCSVAMANPHHPHKRICHRCDGDGVVRDWKYAWFSKHKCRECDGRGYFLMPPAPKPMPKKIHDKGPAHVKHPPHAQKHDRRNERNAPPKGKRPR